MTQRADAVKGLGVLPKRWMVERTCVWFTRDRRHRKDDDLLPEPSAALLQVTRSHLMIRRLARIALY
jgi:hypothetical protein